eukprot:1155414-Pelagomonas_calceolata.AAC.1
MSALVLQREAWVQRNGLITKSPRTEHSAHQCCQIKRMVAAVLSAKPSLFWCAWHLFGRPCGGCCIICNSCNRCLNEARQMDGVKFGGWSEKAIWNQRQTAGFEVRKEGKSENQGWNLTQEARARKVSECLDDIPQPVQPPGSSVSLTRHPTVSSLHEAITPAPNNLVELYIQAAGAPCLQDYA